MKKNILTLLTGILFFVPLYGYAEELPTKLILSTTTEELLTGTTAASTTPLRTFTTCSQEAIEARDTRIASSRFAYNTVMVNALTERKNKEKTAVALSLADEKKEAMKVSVDAYKHQVKTAQTNLTQARKTVWQTFENDVKKCRDLEQVQSVTGVETSLPQDEKVEAKGKKAEVSDTKMTEEPKSFRDTLKTQLENFKSLFN